MLTPRWAVAALLAASLIAPGLVSAQADETPVESGGGRVTISKDWETPGTGGGGSPGGPGGSAQVRQICKSGDRVVDCDDGLGGAWSPSRRCYVTPELIGRPKPPGETSGQWYRCGWEVFAAWTVFWLATPPETGPPPSQLAGRAVAELNLRPIAIGITPKNGAKGLVGLPTWLWVGNPAANTWGPARTTKTSGPVSVSLEAHVDKVVWDMGDGKTVTCPNRGTEYRKAFGGRPSPNCGYEYRRSSNDQPGKAYTVRAISYWVVDWEETSGGGQSGQIFLELESSTELRVGELQVLVR